MSVLGCVLQLISTLTGTHPLPVGNLPDTVQFVKYDQQREVERGVLHSGEKSYINLQAFLDRNRDDWSKSFVSYVNPRVRFSWDGVVMKVYRRRVVVDVTRDRLVQSFEKPVQLDFGNGLP